VSVFFWFLIICLALLVGVLVAHQRFFPPKRELRAAWWYKDPVREMFRKIPVPPPPKRVVPEMMVFNKELSIEEIRGLYEGRSVAEDRLVAAWGRADRVIGPDEKVTYLGSELTLAQKKKLAGLPPSPPTVDLRPRRPRPLGPKRLTE